VYRLTVASPSRWTTNRPWKGRGYVTWHVLNFGCPIHISGMAEASALNFFTMGDYIKSCQNDNKSPLKGAWFCSRDPIFVCTTVDLEKNFATTRCWLGSIRSTTDHRAVCLTFDGWGYRCNTLRHKLHQFDLSPYLLQSSLCNVETTNRPSGVWALSFKYVVITDISQCL